MVKKCSFDLSALKNKKGIGRSSVTVDKALRRFLDDLKDELSEILGTTVTDVDLMYHILENYNVEIGLLSLANKIIETTKELIVTKEDYEKLKEEVEELRKENEELRKKIKEGEELTQYSAKELFYAFVRRLSDELEQQGFRNEEIDQIMKTITHIAVTVFPKRSDKPNYKALARLAFVI